MVYLNTWIVIFIAVYAVDYLFFLRPKLVDKKDTMEISFLVKRFSLEKKFLYNVKIFKRIAFLNALIISVVSTILIFLNLHLSLLFLIGFVLLNGLIYSVYELYGRYLVKRGYKGR